jgi:hypothetical protein
LGVNKELILVSRIYQLYIASATTTQYPSVNTDAHSQKMKKKKYKKEKSRYRDQFLVAAALTQSRHH